MRTLLMLAAVAIFALGAQAETVFESWEGSHTVLGMYGAGDPPIIASIRSGAPIDPVHGSQVLQLVDNSPTGTPQAFVAWVRNIAYGDTVTVSLHRYDVTPATAPSCARTSSPSSTRTAGTGTAPASPTTVPIRSSGLSA